MARETVTLDIDVGDLNGGAKLAKGLWSAIVNEASAAPRGVGGGLSTAAHIGQSIASYVRGTAGTVTRAMSDPLGLLGSAGGGIGNLIGGAFGGPGGAALGGALGSMIGDIPKMAMDIAKGMASLVSVFSPYTADQFQRVLNDITGVFGYVLQPIVEAATGYLRLFGDVLFTLAGPMRDFAEQIAKVANSLLPPLIRGAQEIAKMFGLKLKSSTGLSGFKVGTTSLGGLSEQAALAFAEAMRKPDEKEERQKSILDTLNNMSKRLDEIAAAVPNILPQWAR